MTGGLIHQLEEFCRIFQAKFLRERIFTVKIPHGRLFRGALKNYTGNRPYDEHYNVLCTKLTPDSEFDMGYLKQYKEGSQRDDRKQC